ncbi:hypothetical protein VTG60DRAFT_1160 [Thermothelomyces hinnuleus]
MRNRRKRSSSSLPHFLACFLIFLRACSSSSSKHSSEEKEEEKDESLLDARLLVRAPPPATPSSYVSARRVNFGECPLDCCCHHVFHRLAAGWGGWRDGPRTSREMSLLASWASCRCWWLGSPMMVYPFRSAPFYRRLSRWRDVGWKMMLPLVSRTTAAWRPSSVLTVSTRIESRSSESGLADSDILYCVPSFSVVFSPFSPHLDFDDILAQIR